MLALRFVVLPRKPSDLRPYFLFSNVPKNSMPYTNAKPKAISSPIMFFLLVANIQRAIGTRCW